MYAQEYLYRHTGSELAKSNNYIEQIFEIVGEALWRDREVGQGRTVVLKWCSWLLGVGYMLAPYPW